MRRVSKKQKMRDAEWQSLGMVRRKELEGKFGYCVCEFCGKLEGSHEYWRFGGHHLDRNRRNNTYGNYYNVHNVCHSWITNHPLIEIKQDDFYGRVNNINVFESSNREG
uniref:HNH endonuclease n=1 Tax=viral metagenome TaxID=1070528 RepID=A0A6M3KSU4_9ZZZZ